MRSRRFSALMTVLVFGYAFLYIPIISLIVYSFNESRLVTVWGGWSVKWYFELINNPQILDAAWISIKVASVSASCAVILATLCAYALIRYKRFQRRTSLELMVAAPMVLPDVIIGLSLLLLFVTMDALIGWPSGRGQTTITLAHMTIGMAYATVVIRSRLAHFDSSLEEAAMDLGARPFKVFFANTLPIIAPALIAGWLLAFTLSLDDLVIASFVTGPGSTTLPMVVYSSVRLGVSPQINALATIIVVLVSIAVSIAGYLLYRQSKARV